MHHLALNEGRRLAMALCGRTWYEGACHCVVLAFLGKEQFEK